MWGATSSARTGRTGPAQRGSLAVQEPTVQALLRSSCAGQSHQAQEEFLAQGCHQADPLVQLYIWAREAQACCLCALHGYGGKHQLHHCAVKCSAIYALLDGSSPRRRQHSFARAIPTATPRNQTNQVNPITEHSRDAPPHTPDSLGCCAARALHSRALRLK